MKKLLVFLLVLAVVAGGLFAQEAGTFTWTGEVRLGADIDLIPDDPTIKGNGDHQYGSTTLSYDKGALNLEANVNGNIGTPAVKPSLYAEYGDGVNGESNAPYKLAAKVAGDGVSSNIFDFNSNVTVLYGYYTFLDKQLKLDVVYKGLDAAEWTSAAEVVAGSYDNPNDGGIRIKYAPTAVEGLSVGLKLPVLFNDTKEVVEDSFKKTAIGLKYAKNALTVSTGFQFAPSKAEKAYVGAKYVIIPDTLSVKGDAEVFNLGDFGETGFFQAGANVEYTAAPLTAGLSLYEQGVPDNAAVKAAYRADLEAQWDARGSADFPGFTNFEEAFKTFWAIYTADSGIATKSEASTAVFYVKPYVYYNLIATTLQARLPITFGKGISTSTEDLTFVILEPGLFLNLKADGATNDPGRGILLQYALIYDIEASKAASSTVSLLFRWNF